MSRTAQRPFVAVTATVRMPRRKLTAAQAAQFDALRASIEAQLAESGKRKVRRARMQGRARFTKRPSL